MLPKLGSFIGSTLQNMAIVAWLHLSGVPDFLRRDEGPRGVCVGQP